MSIRMTLGEYMKEQSLLEAESRRYEDLCEQVKDELDNQREWAVENFKDYAFNCYHTGKHYGQSLDAVADRWVEEQAAQRLEREKKETME